VWPRLRSALTAKAADELSLKVLAAREAVLREGLAIT
jgi:hypothetical protein